jgi:hypothetical protein
MDGLDMYERVGAPTDEDEEDQDRECESEACEEGKCVGMPDEEGPSCWSNWRRRESWPCTDRVEGNRKTYANFAVGMQSQANDILRHHDDQVQVQDAGSATRQQTRRQLITLDNI